jgi:hypothetical protein
MSLSPNPKKMCLLRKRSPNQVGKDEDDKCVGLKKRGNALMWTVGPRSFIKPESESAKKEKAAPIDDCPEGNAVEVIDA